jgi:hypothetical protein
MDCNISTARNIVSYRVDIRFMDRHIGTPGHQDFRYILNLKVKRGPNPSDPAINDWKPVDLEIDGAWEGFPVRLLVNTDAH